MHTLTVESREATLAIDDMVLDAMRRGVVKSSDIMKDVRANPKWLPASEVVRKASGAYSATTWNQYWPSRCLDFSLQRLRRAKRIKYSGTTQTWTVVA